MRCPRGLIEGQGAVWWERIRALWRSDPRFATGGLPESPIGGLVLRNVKVEADKGFRIRHATVEGTPGMFAVTAGPPVIVQRNSRLQ